MLRHEDKQAHQNSHTFYLSYEGPLSATARAKEVKVESIKEEIVFPLESRRVLRAYEEYEDLPEDAAVLAYSLAEIAAKEWLSCSMRHGTNRVTSMTSGF